MTNKENREVNVNVTPVSLEQTYGYSKIIVPEGYVPIQSSSPFGGINGPIFEREDPIGRVWRGFRVAPQHTNQASVVHGGMLMFLADIILGRQAWHDLSAPAVTVRLSSEFIAQARQGDWVHGFAQTMGMMSANLITMRAKVYCGARLIFAANGTFKAIRSKKK